MSNLEQRLNGLARLAALAADLPSACIVGGNGVILAVAGLTISDAAWREPLAAPGGTLLVGNNGPTRPLSADRVALVREVAREIEHVLREHMSTEQEAVDIFQASLDVSPFGMLVTNADGELRTINRTLRGMLGLGPDDVARRDQWLERVHPEDRAGIGAIWASALKRGEATEATLRLAAASGELACALRLRRMEVGGRFVGMLALLVDRSTEANLSDELRRSQEMWGTALDCADHGVWVFTAPTQGRFFYSDAWKAVLGYAPDELGDDFETWNNIVHPDDIGNASEAFNRYLRGETRIYTVESRMRCKDGSFRWIHSRGRATQADQNGIVLVGTNTDVTERRLMEERLRDSERRLLDAERLAGVGHWEWRDGVEHLILTPETYRVLGRDPEPMPAELLARRVADPSHTKPLIAAIRAVRQSGEPCVVEHELTRLDGTLVHCRSHIHRELGPSGMAIVGTLQDITSEVHARETLRRAKEEAEAAVRMRTEFLATMSHEIRTPLNGVLGLSALLSSTELDAEQREYVDGARAAGQSLLALINDVLDFSKIEAGALVLEPHPFSPVELVEDTVAMLAEGAHARGLDLWLDIEPQVPTELVGDLARLRQICINLVGNALKFTDSGEVEVRVAADVHDDVAELRLSVRDTGIGIAPEASAHLFDAFVQADDPARRHRGGTGLGLAISRRLAREMRGDITVRSTLGAGSEFTFAVPLPIERQAVVRPMLLPGVRVLVVDQRRGTEAIARMLEAEGATVVRGDPWTFPSPSAALGQTYDVALVDSELATSTELSQLVVLLEVIGRDGPASCVALVDMAGRARIEDGRFAAVVTRPVRRATIIETIARCVSRDLPLPQKPWAASGLALRVLVAEDNPVNQFLMTQVLKKLDCTVVVVSDGRDAVEAMRTERYDIILMDCFMPNLDGFEATRAIRATSAGRHVPIVALTAGAIEADRKRCFEAGMDDYLTKPFEVAQLVRVLERWRAQ